MREHIYQESCANCGAEEQGIESDYAVTYNDHGDAICDDCGADRGVFSENRSSNDQGPPEGGDDA